MKRKRYWLLVPAMIGLALFNPLSKPEAAEPFFSQIAGAIILSPPLTATATATSTPIAAPTNTPTQTPTFVPTLTPTRTHTPIPTREPTVRVPILMYHYISNPPPDADKYRLDLSVTPANFEAQMQYLVREGYHPIRVSDLADYLLDGTPMPSKPIVISFDDGYCDNYENTFPVLKQLKFPATFFVITQSIDTHREGYMTWDQLEEMAIEGMEIGSHSLTHPDLQGKSRAIQTTEIAGSKAMIEARIGTPVNSFSYPASKYDARAIEITRAAGYRAAVTADAQGTLHSANAIYELKRIRVRGSYSVNDLAYWIKYFMANGK